MRVMRYIISEDKLYTKIGTVPFWSVKIASIKSVERSYKCFTLSHSPSVVGSLKKLRITYEGMAHSQFILVSPVKEQEFIEELKIINPKIHVHVIDKKGKWRIQDWDI
jgi:hypothetical protein